VVKYDVTLMQTISIHFVEPVMVSKLTVGTGREF